MSSSRHGERYEPANPFGSLLARVLEDIFVMSTFKVTWPVCVGLALALSGCVMDTSESDDGDHERIGETPLALEGVSGEGEDDGTETGRQDTDDGSSTETDANSVAVPHAEPDPEPWDPGNGQGSDDG